MSTISFIDEPSHDDHSRPPVRMENTYQMLPSRRFPHAQITSVIKDVLEGYLSEEKYEPELCKQMTKTLSEVIHMSTIYHAILGLYCCHDHPV